MLKTVSGKRDLGQCEVSRLLLSGPLYSSSFQYITQSLELHVSKLVKIHNNKENSDSVTNKSLIERYSHRAENAFMFEGNLYDFVKKFKIFKGKFFNNF